MFCDPWLSQAHLRFDGRSHFDISSFGGEGECKSNWQNCVFSSFIGKYVVSCEQKEQLTAESSLLASWIELNNQHYHRKAKAIHDHFSKWLKLAASADFPTTQKVVKSTEEQHRRLDTGVP